MDKMRMESLDMTAQNIEKIGALFPNCITETKDASGKPKKAINFDLLRQMLSADVIEGNEAYEFTWVGKKAAIVEANKPIRKTLRPCKEESYLGKVKMIYIDPPYNTGNDFIYRDDFAMESEEWRVESGEIDDDGNRLFRNTDTNGRFHSDWCSMIYSRLMLARNLLADDGVIFISIDDNEQENLKKCSDEVFGESNFIGKIAIVNNLKGRNDKKDIATCHEYLLMYGKSEFSANGMPLTDEQREQFDKVDENGNAYQLRDLRKRGRPDRREDRPNMYFPIYYNVETRECSLVEQTDAIAIYPVRGDGSDGRWRWGKEKVAENLKILEPRYSTIAQRWGIEHRVYLNPSMNPVTSDEEETEGMERSSKSKSFWIGGELSNDVGRRQLKELFGTAYFDYPKAINYVLNTIHMGANSDSIILDFFSGSATTAHAVMELNAEDGGHRKFIMVQLPEPCDEKSEAYKAGYANICEIGKERIRRAGQKILAELAEKETAAKEATLFDDTSNTPPSLDVGFRVLKLDDTNMKDVYYAPADYEQGSLDEWESNIKEDRSDLDLLFGCLLEWGLPLSLPYKSEEIAGCTVHNYNDGDLVACFDENIPTSVIKTIAKRQPLRAVFRDSSFADSPAKINVTQIFKELAPDTSVKVL